MDPKNKPAKKNLESVPSKVEALVWEAEDHIQSWIQNVHSLFQMLQSFSLDEQENFFRLLLKKGNEQAPFLLEVLRGKEEKLDLALARSLGHWFSPQAADLLHRLAATAPSKTVSKAIRKSIFRLKSKGLPVEEFDDRPPAVYHPPQPAGSEGFLTSIDFTGKRMVWLARPQIPQGMAAFSALISDCEGIVDFNGLETTRKNFHEYLATFQERVPWEIVEADPEYCLGLIVEAAEIGQKQGQAPSPEFLKWRPLMGPAPALPVKPLIYQYLRKEEAESRTDLLDRSASLLQAPSFQSWFLEKEESQKYLTLLQQASESRLVLTPYQKESRVMEIHQQAVHELFDEPRRLLCRRRLEEMAYVLWKKGQENESRMSLAAAAGLEKESGILSPHPFLLELVKRSLASLIEEEKEKKDKEPGLIVRP